MLRTAKFWWWGLTQGHTKNALSGFRGKKSWSVLAFFCSASTLGGFYIIIIIIKNTCQKNKANIYHQPVSLTGKGWIWTCSDVSVNCQKVHLANSSYISPLILFPPTPKGNRVIIWTICIGTVQHWTRIKKRKGMLGAESITHICSAEVIERWMKAGRVLGTGISTGDQARQMLTLPYGAELLTPFPNLQVPSCWVAVKMAQVVREKQCVN